jgi:hypothetical protein
MATETSARPITVHDDTSFMKTSSVPILTANAGGITALLRALKLLSIIEGTEVKPTTGSEAWQSRHDKAFCLLLDHIDDEQFSSIQDQGADAAACWTHLCAIHEPTDLSRQFMLVRQLWMTTYDPSQTTLSAHISKSDHGRHHHAGQGLHAPLGRRAAHHVGVKSGTTPLASDASHVASEPDSGPDVLAPRTDSRTDSRPDSESDSGSELLRQRD